MHCECVLAGFCKRHNIRKGAEWVALCQSRADYFRVWEEGRGPGQPVDPARVQEQSDEQERRLQYYRDLWKELHASNMTPSQFENWCLRVPNIGCSCEPWLREYLVDNPPRYDKLQWFAFSVELHNAVNAKLSREQWTIERAREHYQVKKNEVPELNRTLSSATRG